MNFFQGDLVSYVGEKFRGDLGGKMGEICAPVVNQSGTYVVSFGGDDYVMSDKFLSRFQGHLRSSEDKQPEKKERRQPKVEARRGRHSQEESDIE
jgi:hypothetical protein